MREPFDLKAAIDALTMPRILHTTQPDAANPREVRIRSIQHPPLIDLLEQGTGTSRRGNGSGGMPGPIDAGALETWAQIRDQVRAWLGQLRAPWSDDLKADLRSWYLEHDIAVATGRVHGDRLEDIERTVASWKSRIERKYDPDEQREWTEPCPAVIGERSNGDLVRCGARRILIGSDGRLAVGEKAKNASLQFAISLNVTRREAECRSCGAAWHGERELMSLRYETNLVELERDLQRAAAAPPPELRRDLALTGPIDLP